MDMNADMDFDVGLIVGETPDSGIDISKFNLVDYVIGDAEDESTSFVTLNNAILSQQNKVSSLSLPPLRTLTKQELQRQKALEDSKREREVQQATLHPPPQSNPVDLPPIAPANLANIPKKLLVVETRLENPTKYHLQKCVQQNIARYSLDTSGAKGGSVPPNAFNPQLHSIPEQPYGAGSAPPNIFASPIPSYSSVSSAPNAAAEEVLDPNVAPSFDIDTDLNSISLNDISELMVSQDGAESGAFSLPYGQGTPESRGSGTPIQSPSTPQDESASAKAVKDRQKKDNHNKIERRRRCIINDMITIQGQQLPKPNEPHYERFGEVKQNKGAILQASVEYINTLKEENENYRLMDKNNKQQLQQAEQERRKLLLRIQELEQLCTANGINIPEESLTWRSRPPEAITSLVNSPIRTVKQEVMEDATCGLAGNSDPMLGGVDDILGLQEYSIDMDLN